MRRILLLLLCAAACGDSTRTVAVLDLAFETPVDGASVFSKDPFTARIRATTNDGLKSLELRVGTLVAATCPAGEDDTEIVCEQSLAPAEWVGQQQGDRLTLTAIATNLDDETKEASVQVVVSPVFVEFVQPTDTSKAAGTSTLELRVRGEVGIDRVEVTVDDGLPLHDFAGEPWSTEIDWPAEVRVGTHSLTAEVFDVQARSATATIGVQVACESDAHCEVGETCCANGTCAAVCG